MDKAQWMMMMPFVCLSFCDVPSVLVPQNPCTRTHPRSCIMLCVCVSRCPLFPPRIMPQQTLTGMVFGRARALALTPVAAALWRPTLK